MRKVFCHRSRPAECCLGLPLKQMNCRAGISVVSATHEIAVIGRRLFASPDRLIDRVLPALTRWRSEAIAAGTRTRLALPPHERELERYGGPETTAVYEALTCADSTAVRAMLRAARSVRGSRVLDLM
jgi:hypothetical protein